MTADALLEDLRNSRTDLAHLVERVLEKRRAAVIVSAEAVDAWDAREPHAWRKVREWLAAEGVAVTVA